MPRQSRIHAPGLLYHVLSRGNQKQQIFRGSEDYRAYLSRIAEAGEKFPFRFYAYALMPNHTHLLLEVKGMPLSKIMQIVQQRYTQYFNKKYGKAGHIFQGRYKAIVCQGEAYLLELVRYLHLNPVRAGLVKNPIEYPWSSHKGYLAAKCDDWLERDAVLAQFSNNRKRAQKMYDDFVMAAVDSGHRSDLYELKEQQILGDEDFLASLPMGTSTGLDKRLPSIPIERICKIVCEKMRIPIEFIISPGGSQHPNMAREIICFIAIERGHSLVNIANVLNRDITSVSKANSRFRRRIQNEKECAKLVETVLKELGSGLNS